MFYVFDGDDEFSQHEALAALKTQWAPADMLSLNTTTFDGAKVSLEELRHACDSVPFLSSVRLVIVEGLLSRLGQRSKDFETRLLEYVPLLPATTRLVFMEPSSLPAANRFVRLAEAQPDAGVRRRFVLPNVRNKKGREEAARWIRQRAKAKGARLEPEAVSALVDLVGNDYRQLDSELEKLSTYCEGAAVTLADVNRLVPLARESVIWDLTDAINDKRLRDALTVLSRLQDDGEAPLRTLTMIVRNYRILIETAELVAQRQTNEGIASRLGLTPWNVEKAVRGTRGVPREALLATYRTLLETDTDIKTGRQEPEAALQFLVTRLCQ